MLLEQAKLAFLDHAQRAHCIPSCLLLPNSRRPVRLYPVATIKTRIDLCWTLFTWPWYLTRSVTEWHHLTGLVTSETIAGRLTSQFTPLVAGNDRYGGDTVVLMVEISDDRRHNAVLAVLDLSASLRSRSASQTARRPYFNSVEWELFDRVEANVRDTSQCTQFVYAVLK